MMSAPVSYKVSQRFIKVELLFPFEEEDPSFKYFWIPKPAGHDPAGLNFDFDR